MALARDLLDLLVDHDFHHEQTRLAGHLFDRPAHIEKRCTETYRGTESLLLHWS
jgi:hypothetical protein